MRKPYLIIIATFMLLISALSATAANVCITETGTCYADFDTAYASATAGQHLVATDAGTYNNGQDFQVMTANLTFSANVTGVMVQANYDDEGAQQQAAFIINTADSSTTTISNMTIQSITGAGTPDQLNQANGKLILKDISIIPNANSGALNSNGGDLTVINSNITASNDFGISITATAETRTVNLNNVNIIGGGSGGIGIYVGTDQNVTMNAGNITMAVAENDIEIDAGVVNSIVTLNNVVGLDSNTVITPVLADGNGVLRQWTTTVNVTDSSLSPLNAATVTANSQQNNPFHAGTTTATNTTGSNGLTTLLVTATVTNTTGTFSLNDYSFNSSLATYTDNITSFTVAQNGLIHLILQSANSAPDTPVITSPSGSGTGTNINFSITTNDDDLDPLTNRFFVDGEIVAETSANSILHTFTAGSHNLSADSYDGSLRSSNATGTYTVTSLGYNATYDSGDVPVIVFDLLGSLGVGFVVVGSLAALAFVYLYIRRQKIL